MIMRCLTCGRDTMRETTTAYFGQLSGGRYLIIENVPCKRCDECGEEFFDMDAMGRIQAIVRNCESVESKVSIFNYSEAA